MYNVCMNVYIYVYMNTCRMQVPAPMRQGARLRFDELESRVLRMHKKCQQLEREIIDDYDKLASAKSIFRGSLMEIWFTAWEISSRTRASAVQRYRAKKAKAQAQAIAEAAEDTPEEMAVCRQHPRVRATPQIDHRPPILARNCEFSGSLAEDEAVQVAQRLMEAEVSIRHKAGQCMKELRQVAQTDFGFDRQECDRLTFLLRHLFNGGTRKWDTVVLDEEELDSTTPTEEHAKGCDSPAAEDIQPPLTPDLNPRVESEGGGGGGHTPSTRPHERKHGSNYPLQQSHGAEGRARMGTSVGDGANSSGARRGGGAGFSRNTSSSSRLLLRRISSFCAIPHPPSSTRDQSPVTIR